MPTVTIYHLKDSGALQILSFIVTYTWGERNQLSRTHRCNHAELSSYITEVILFPVMPILELSTSAAEPCPIGVYLNFARHTRGPRRKMESSIGHVWWLTNDQAISFASRTGKIYQTKLISFAASCSVAGKTREAARATLDKQSCVITPTFVYHD